MNLQLAKTRRLEALNNRKCDRVMVKPAAHSSQVNMPDEGTVADYLIEALRHGVDLGDLASETGWSRSMAMVNLYKVAKKTGVGVRRHGDVLSLVLPKGCERDYINPKVVNTSAEIHEMAAEVVVAPAVKNVA